MKLLKKMSALLVAVVMMAVTVVPALAEESTSTEKANIIVNENMKGRTLKAYQVFKATEVTPTSEIQLNEIKNVSWGDNINKTTFITKLNKIEGIQLDNDSTSNEVAKAIEAIKNDSAKAIQVAKAALAAKDGEGTLLELGNNNVALGYYLIVDETNSSELNPGQAINPAILLVNGDVTVKEKNQDINVDKLVKNETDTTFEDATNSSIGKIVTFRYVAPVIKKEALAQYETYKYQFEDTLSEGVDVIPVSEQNNNVKFNAYLVDVPDASAIPTNLIESENATDITQKFLSTPVNNQKFTITCDDLRTLTDANDEAGGKFIVIEYTGKLNEKAIIGSTGNLNTVTLKYSNDPNHSGSGDPMDGETPPSTAIVFTFGYDGTKVDIATPEDVLAGAKFVVSRQSGTEKEYALFDSKDNTTDASAVRKIKDWKTIADFDHALEIYKKSLEGETLTAVEEEMVNNFKQFVITSDEDGKFGAKGLGNGTYFLNEIVQPEGYVRPNNEFEFTISSKVSNTNGIGAVTELKIDDLTMDTPSTGLVTGTIENSSTVNLPETGGMGTTLLYVAGGILLIGSAVLLVTKKRMGHEN